MSKPPIRITSACLASAASTAIFAGTACVTCAPHPNGGDGRAHGAALAGRGARVAGPTSASHAAR